MDSNMSDDARDDAAGFRKVVLPVKSPFYFTREELEAEWLAKWPDDADYKFNAVAGFIETAKGFIWGSYYVRS